MKTRDAIGGIVCGLAICLVATDFLPASIMIWILLPAGALVCLWLASLIGKKWLFAFQVAKHLLVGALATVVDVRLFEFLVSVLGIITNLYIVKGVSFIASTGIKYLGNKYWAFEKQERDAWQKEMAYFFCISVVGLLLDVAAFYFFTTIMTAQFGLSALLWRELSVILAAAIAAAWNFSGYKFLVFKK